MRSKPLTYLISLCLLLGGFMLAHAQGGVYEKQRGIESWSSGVVKWKPHKKFTLSVEEQVRFSFLRPKPASFDRIFTEFQAKYHYDKVLSTAIGVRYIGRNDVEGGEQGYENHLRFHGDFALKFKLKRWTLTNRLRYQHRNQLGKTKEDGDYVSQDLRWKSTFKYNIKDWKFDPEAGFEVFYHMETGELNGFARNRLFLGTEYNLDKHQELGFVYRRERETKLWQPRIAHIFMVRYTYRLRKRKDN